MKRTMNICIYTCRVGAGLITGEPSETFRCIRSSADETRIGGTSLVKKLEEHKDFALKYDLACLVFLFLWRI